LVLSLVLAKAGTCSGTCLELSKSDNQLLNQKNGTKSGNCLGSVWEILKMSKKCLKNV
jgi:hypothetical protein